MRFSRIVIKGRWKSGKLWMGSFKNSWVFYIFSRFGDPLTSHRVRAIKQKKMFWISLIKSGSPKICFQHLKLYSQEITWDVGLWKTRTVWRSGCWSWRVTLSASTFPRMNSDLQNCRACSRVRPMPLRKRPYCIRPPWRRWWLSLRALCRCLLQRGKDFAASWWKRMREWENDCVSVRI